LTTTATRNQWLPQTALSQLQLLFPKLPSHGLPGNPMLLTQLTASVSGSEDINNMLNKLLNMLLKTVSQSTQSLTQLNNNSLTLTLNLTSPMSLTENSLEITTKSTLTSSAGTMLSSVKMDSSPPKQSA
jgi:hypothetical protein